MTPERWQCIDELFQSALELAPNERRGFIEQVCAGDEALRLEVESLIASHERTGEFLDAPAYQGGTKSLADESEKLAAGEILGQYKVLRYIRSGGMGDVYLAQHTKLGGKVALKLLPADFARDEKRVRRFQQEARAASALNHPCVCVIHEIDRTDDGHHYIAMEYIDGITLRDRINQGPLKLAEAMGVAEQVAVALQAAHEAGIVHRDIKPENIMVHRDGYVKVLDFGLAKLVENYGLQGDIHEASTIPRAQTEGGRMGTVKYMSPEQLRELPIDERTDIWSLGVMLHEMVTGVTPFEAHATAESITLILAEAPPTFVFPAPVPAEFRLIASKALTKKREERYQTVEELLLDLRTLRQQLQRENEGELPLHMSVQSNAGAVAAALPTDKTRESSTIGASKSQAHSTLTTLFADAFRKPSVFMYGTGVILVVALLFYFGLVPRLFTYHPSPAASRWYAVGTTALRNGSYFEASKALQQAVANDDNFALAHARLAEAYSELDYSDRAKDEIIRAQSLARELWLSKSDSIYLKAVTSTVLRDFPPAIESYQRIASEASDQEKANVYLDLGRAYEKNDELKKAKENYEEAIRLAPQEPASFLRLGIACGQLQDFPCASEAFQSAESTFQALSNYEGVAEVLFQRGFLFTYQAKFPDARTQLERAQEMTRATGNHYQLIRVLQLLSMVSALEGHLTVAEDQATQAIQLAKTNNIENLATSGLTWLGNALLFRGDYGAAEKYYQQALDLAQRDKMRVNEAWALTQMGSLRSQQHRSEESLHYVEQAVAFYQQNGYHKWLSLTLPLVGRAYRDKGDYEASLKAFEDQIKVGEQLSDQAQVANADIDIGFVLSYKEQYSEALRRFNDGYGIFKSLNADVYVAYANQSRASVLWRLGSVDDARVALDDATSMAEHVERPEDTYRELLADVHLTRAQLYLSAWRLPDSQSESRKALDLATNQYPAIEVEAKCALGLAQSRSGTPRSGMLLCEEAVDLAKSMGDPRLLSDALLALAEAAFDNGETQHALETALRAQESFARYSRSDSEWRALLIAARASKRLRNETAASQYASQAVRNLSALEQKLGSESFKGYLERADVKRFRKHLDQLKL